MDSLSRLAMQLPGELKLKEELLNIIKRYSDRLRGESETGLRKKCEEFSELIILIVKELESSRRYCLRLEQDKLRIIRDELLKKRLVTPEIEALFGKIEVKLKDTFIKDENLVGQLNKFSPAAFSGSAGGIDITGLPSSIRGSMGSANETSLLDKIKNDVGVYSKLPFVKRLLAREMKRNLANDTKRLLEDYEHDFEQFFIVSVQLDSMEYRLFSDLNTIYLALQKLSSYFDLKKEMYLISSAMDAIRRSISSDISLESRDETFLKRMADELREKEKASLAFSLLRPNDAEAHAEELIKTGVAVHLTDYFPHQGIIRTTMDAMYDQDLKGSPSRRTIHFAINHAVKPVAAAGNSYSWAGKKYAVLAPMAKMPLDRMIDMDETDTFFAGTVRIPEGSIIVAKSGSLQKEVVEPRFKTVDNLMARFMERGIKIILIDENSSIINYVDSLIAKMGRSIYVRPALYNGSEAHYHGTWGIGGLEGTSNVVLNFRNELMKKETYHEGIPGYVPKHGILSLTRSFLGSVSGSFKEINNLDMRKATSPERRKALLNILDMATKTLDQMEIVLGLEYESIRDLKSGHIISSNDREIWQDMLDWISCINKGIVYGGPLLTEEDGLENTIHNKTEMADNPKLKKELTRHVESIIKLSYDIWQKAKPLYEDSFGYFIRSDDRF